MGTTSFPPDHERLSTIDMDQLLENIPQGHTLDTEEEEWEMALNSGIPKSSGPRYEAQMSRPKHEGQMLKPTCEGQMLKPTYEAQAGPLDGVPRIYKSRGPRPNFGQKGAKVVTL